MKPTRDGSGYLYARTARRTHYCDGSVATCVRVIRPGDPYTVAKLPPHSDIGNVGWWRLPVCRGCRPVDRPERVALVRPDGRVYVARTSPRAALLAEEPGEPLRVVVLGTHDEVRARALAERVAPVDPWPNPPTWLRLAIRRGELEYVVDEQRGAPALVFEAA